MIAGQFIVAAWFIIATVDRKADSIGRRNALFIDLREPPVKLFSRRSPAQRLARSPIERCCHGRKSIGAMCAEIGALGKVLAQ